MRAFESTASPETEIDEVDKFMKIEKLKKLRQSLWLAISIAVFAVAGIAQTESARIQGTVSDATGAVVAGATVMARSVGTARESSTVTNSEGNYSILALQPGRYQIEVTQTSFKKIQQEVTLEVAQTAVLDFVLETGEVTETVTVTLDIPQVETATSALGEVIQGREAVELPLNGRNVLELARLSPGVTQGIPAGFATGVSGNAETYRGRNTGGAALSVNGQRTQANNFLLDGVDNNESLVNTINVFPSAEAVQEFRVQTSVASAEFGRGGGAIVNSVVKSGRNDFYGSAFLFIRNDNLDARPTFNATKNEFRRSQYGGSIGGPVLKDRVFFFGNFEGLRQFLPLNEESATVPTQLMRTGNFSELLGNTSVPNNGQLIDILTGLPIAGNRVDLLPGGRMNQVGLNYLNAFPLPTRAGVFNNFVTTRNETTDQDTFDIRIDSTINDKNQLFGRYSYGKFDQVTSSRLPDLPAGFGSGTNPTRTRGLVVGLNTAFTNTLFNEFRIQTNYIRYGYTPPFFDQQISADLGIPNANRDENLGGGALIGGWNGQLEYTGDFGPYLVPQTTYQIVDSLSYTTGDHTLKFGGTLLRRDVSLYRPNRGKGYFFLMGNGSGPNCGTGAQSTGWEQSDLLIGFVCNYQIGPPFGTVGTRNWENGLFIQDDWRATKNLTLNLGLRYEYFTNPTEMYGRQANFDIETGRLIVASDNGDALVETDTNNFGPRIGFAYDFGGRGKTVLRGGYGLFYFLDRGGIDNQLAQNPPYSGFSQFNYTDGARITLSGRAPDGSLDSRLATGTLPLGSVDSVDLNNPTNVSVLAWLPDNKTSNVHQFNIQVQQQLTNDTAISLAYVGSRGRNLINYYNLNGQIVEPGTEFACPRALVNNQCFPTLNGSARVRADNGESQYDGLQMSLERRFSKGWQYRVAYTLSKTKDNGDGAYDSVADSGKNFIEPFSTSRSDFPHVLSIESVYDIPFGKGRRWGSDSSSVVDAILGGWQLNGIWRISSGQTFDVRRNGIRVDLVGDPYTGGRDPYLDRTAFQDAPAGRFGTLERNGLRGPIGNQLNMGVTKNFTWGELFKVQFRTEFFNLFNTPQLTPPNTDLGNNDPVFGFGTIRSTYGFTNRQIQFGLRLEF